MYCSENSYGAIPMPISAATTLKRSIKQVKSDSKRLVIYLLIWLSRCMGQSGDTIAK